MSSGDVGPGEPLLRGQGLFVFVAVVTAVALIGLVAGMRPWHDRTPVAGDVRPPEPAPDGPVMAARGYGEIAERPLRRAHPGAAELDREAIGPRGYAGPLIPTDEARARARAERAERRAYEGAPPVIPHPTRQLGPQACMACHDEGVRIGLRLAPPMGHDYKSACTQCHVGQESPMPFAERDPDALPLDNAFVGLRELATDVEPAYAGAPSGVPHPTHMRERCDSCHGSAGRAGLRTDHTWRVSCTQCHAPSALSDLSPIAEGGPSLPEGYP